MHPYVIKSLMWQLLNGITYMHQNWIIHRDLKVGMGFHTMTYVHKKSFWIIGRWIECVK